MAASRWNAATVITLLRIPVAAPGAYLLARGEHLPLAVAFLVAAALTDILDGWVARATGTVTDFGKKVDPVVDKIVIAGVGVILVLKYDVPAWIFAAAVVRDVAILAAAAVVIKRRDVVVPANFWGKTAAMVMVVYAVAAVAAPASAVTTVFLWIVLASLIVSSASYAYDLYRVMRSGERRRT
ncbi:MAG: CDP-alcohol phosphatidyltransferase family protein [Candidatus Coatesbacteria bacterium]|nr:MAG: CDP-alcohol phosphatidyltransferase family protein [Candidatus Coatesbacteria bacterium]